MTWKTIRINGRDVRVRVVQPPSVADAMDKMAREGRLNFTAPDVPKYGNGMFGQTDVRREGKGKG